MTKKIEIICDHCGEDLRYTGYESEYRLALTPEPKGHTGGAVFATRRWPDIDSEKHFCGIGCLSGWLAAEFPRVSGPVVVTPNTKEPND